MKHPKKILLIPVVASALLALGATGGGWWARHDARSASTAAHAPQAAAQTERKVLYWYDPMAPQQRFDQPGKSPFMGMELVPKYADETDKGSGVKIDPAAIQNLGVRLAKVERMPLATQVGATGLIAFNERDVAVVQSRVGGFVERAWPLAPGDVVKAGQPLVELLVPEWAAVQHEWLALRSVGDAALQAAASERLRLSGMPEALIREVEQSGTARSRYTVTAPIGGVVQALEVRAGMTVMAGQTLARLNGLSTVWLDVAVPEALADAVRVGSRAQARLPAFPGQLIEGRVTAILPALQETTRSLRVRVELPNPNGRLRPGLSAQVTLTSPLQDTALAVPTEAVIRTGQRALVMVAQDNGRFMPVEVTLGREIGDRTVIAAGLAERQHVIASGQFLIDSEASLRGIVLGAASEPAAMASTALHEADATIEAIEGNKITLAHGPFKTLAMPGMTMAYPLANPALVQGLKVGDRVRIGVRQTDAGLVVERLEQTRGGR
ncbi:MAG: efflux RND transporter periplasmic adaptor subunit [Candidatus Tectomicrobia bacterium]|nr:efflux RND transporter periplasmic adaptor subunit [Candidatus Tectomicrobia bacterium]